MLVCTECGDEFVGRRCPKCGTLPEEHTKSVPSLGDLLNSRKFVGRMFRDSKPYRYHGDTKPWNEW